MEISKVRDNAMFRTDYDEKHDLVQIFRGVGCESPYFNWPTDFIMTGLMEKGEVDPFRPSKIISFSTDEVAPCRINGRWIGADHSHPYGVEVKAEHGLDYSYLATDFIGDGGNLFTLVHILDESTLLFLSENLGESDTDYKYNQKITGNLTSKLDGKTVKIEAQSLGLIKSNRQIFRGSMLDREDYAELYDVYDIINLPSAIRQFKDERPAGGYAKNQDITDFGEVMISMKMTYRIMADGTIFVMFDNERKMPISWDLYGGTMYQIKNNIYGGKTRRFIPNLGKVKDRDGNVVSLSEGYDPKTHFGEKMRMIKSDVKIDKNIPLDRVIDIFYDEEGNAKMGFACGYLPIYDGEPSIRNTNEDLIILPYSGKAYPVFLSGDLKRAKGVAYRKFFIPKGNENFEYEITFEGKTYKYKV